LNTFVLKSSLMSETGGPAAFLRDDTEAVGAQLKRLRATRGWSLSRLAAAAGVSVGLLSQIERGRSIPSLRTLTKLRVALDVSLGELIGQPDVINSNEVRHVKRSNSRETLSIGGNQLIKEFLSPFKSEHLQFMLLNVAPGGGSGKQTYSYDGEKAGLVLEGRFKLRLGDDVFELAEGDSFQFDSSIPHAFENLGDIPAKIVWIICRISFRSDI
ncbi:helix-turn-helix domain-containing protein, partial [Pelagibacterium sediminicola]|uniref:helix-turn-helix domain-containing protein n=1 Tax=Pelagibacterium sediminicola TaxID=2248761 RepID=UPI001AEC9DBE